MVIMAWLEPETRDPFKEIFKLPVRGSTVLEGDSQQTDNERTQKHYRELLKRMPKIKTQQIKYQSQRQPNKSPKQTPESLCHGLKQF